MTLGARGIPELSAGQALSHLPHSAHEKLFSKSFHVNSFHLEAPVVTSSLFETIVKSEGWLLLLNKTLNGEASRCMCFEYGIYAKKKSTAIICIHQKALNAAI